MAVDFDSMYSLCILASGVTLMFMGLIYAIGTLFQNPRMTVWVKTEIFQVFVSVAIVMIVLFLVGLIGLNDSDFTLKGDWIEELSGGEETASGSSVFSIAENYVEDLGDFDSFAVQGARSGMGAFEEYSKYTKQPCIPGWLFCLLGQNGASFQPLSGSSAQMQAMNLLLYTSITSALTAKAQYYLLVYLQSGMLAVYLALGLVLRSLPFMREFGGGLIAICIALFIIYPSLLYLESAFWDPVDMATEESYDNVSNFVDNNTNLGYGDVFFGGGDWRFSDVLAVVPDIIKVCSAAFLASTFLFTFNIVAVAASARAFGRLLGADVDISRLAQII